MKKIIVLVLMVCSVGSSFAQKVVENKEKQSWEVEENVDKLYQTFIPLLDRIQITGNSEASKELRSRWGNVVEYLKNNKGALATEVKNLLVSPTGKTINLEMVKQFVNISGEDSTMKITINLDFLLNELKAMSDKLVQESSKMAEKK